MAQNAMSSVIRAVKSNRKFTPQRAAITLVRIEKSNSDAGYLIAYFKQTSSAVQRVKALLSDNKEAVSYSSIFPAINFCHMYICDWLCGKGTLLKIIITI